MLAIRNDRAPTAYYNDAGMSEPAASPSPRATAVRRLAIWALIVAALLAMFRPGLIGHLANAADPWVFNDDVRTFIWPMFPAPALASDEAAQYIRTLVPPLYLGLYRVTSVALDPATLSKALPYMMLALLIVGVGGTAHRLGGPAATWAAVALLFSSHFFLERMTGGLPRGFGFPLVALATWAAVSGRVTLLAALVVLGAGFYQPVALIGGAMLAVVLVLPSRWRGGAERWTLNRRLVTLAIVGAIALAVILPGVILTKSRFGPPLRADDPAFPEAQPTGRYASDGGMPTDQPLAFTIASWCTPAVYGIGSPWPVPALRTFGDEHLYALLTLLLIVLVAGCARLVADMPAPAVRLLTLPAVALAWYLLADALYPLLHLPQRYFTYTLPVFVAIALPAGAAALARWAMPRRVALQSAVVVALFAAVLLLLGSRGSATAGYVVNLHGQEPLFHAIDALPADAVLAGWPIGPVDSVTYVNRRRVLVFREGHQVFHRDHVLEMRRRASALIDAYFAPDLAPIEALREHWGVTHLLLDRTHYEPGQAPTYFKPFDEQAEAAVRALGNRAPAALSLPAVFDDGRFVLVKLP